MRHPTRQPPPTALKCTATIIAIASSLVLAACGSSGAPKEGGKDQVNAGVIAIVDTAPIHVGKARGFFDKRNIDLTITPVEGGATSTTGVVSGQFQFAFGNIVSLLTAREQGLDVKVVANGNNSTGEPGKDFSAVLVKKDSPIRSAKDLAGKKISVNQQKNIGDTTIRAAVKKDGGDPSRLEFVEIPFPDAPAALDKGQVDAIWVVEPFVTQAMEQGARPVTWNFAEATADLSVAMYFTRGDTDPDLIRRFTEAIKESLSYADSHHDEVRKTMEGYTKMTPEVIKKITLPKWPAEVNRDSVQTIAGLAQEDGVLKGKADIDALLP